MYEIYKLKAEASFDDFYRFVVKNCIKGEFFTSDTLPILEEPERNLGANQFRLFKHNYFLLADVKIFLSSKKQFPEEFI